LKFIILSNGVCKDIKIVQSSGFNILDKEAISTIERAQPFPPIPPELKASSLPMEVSIVFTLQY
ncbi:MAG TPA: energy transducer TonB, partial [Candidatus Omnitrophica bacterium]|nr:energy transducer TonB [Candidatus Omnitrophota bacterium]